MPSAPAHGYRAKAPDGTNIVFDGVFGAYAVPGHVRTYWSGDHYYRNVEGVWLQATAVDGPWDLVAAVQVPETLRQAFPLSTERVSVTLPTGVAVTWEPTLRAFLVTGHPGVFLVDARFLRYLDGVWLASKAPDGPWEIASMKAFPALLRSKTKPPKHGTRVALPSGPELEYDADLALFRVVGKPDTYFREGMFFERRDKKWYRSTQAASGFEEIAVPKAPAALRAYYRRKDGGDSVGKKEAKAGDQRRQTRQQSAKKDSAAGKKAGAKVPKPAGKTKNDKTDDE